MKTLLTLLLLLFVVCVNAVADAPRVGYRFISQSNLVELKFVIPKSNAWEVVRMKMDGSDYRIIAIDEHPASTNVVVCVSPTAAVDDAPACDGPVAFYVVLFPESPIRPKE